MFVNVVMGVDEFGSNWVLCNGVMLVLCCEYVKSIVGC